MAILPQQAASATEPPAGAGSLDTARRWAARWWRPALAVLVLGIAALLLYRTLRGYSPAELRDAVLAVPLARIAAAAGFAAASYFCLTLSDYLALRYAGRPLPWRRAALASFAGVSIGHTLGFAALSSGAVRYRFYRRWGLKPGDLARIILFCGTTVVLGMSGAGGVALLAAPRAVTELTMLRLDMVLALGVVALALPAAYLVLAATLRRSLRIGGWNVALPTLRLALPQVAVGAVNFACVSACLHQTLLAVSDVPYAAATGVFVMANSAAVASHVPGGIGVLEALVVQLFGRPEMIAAVLVFRFVYFLMPFALGALLIAVAEFWYARHSRKPQKA